MKSFLPFLMTAIFSMLLFYTPIDGRADEIKSFSLFDVLNEKNIVTMH